MIRVLFTTNQLDFRGTTNQVYLYAKYNKSILGNQSWVAAPINSDLSSLDLFKEEFGSDIILYEDIAHLNELVSKIGFDVIYYIRYGLPEPLLDTKARQVVHSVFDGSTPYADRYAAISGWLGSKYNIPFVPHIVELPEVDGDYREHLGIPKDALVFGRFGGNDSFDIPFAKEVVYEVASQKPNTYFLFLNTDIFCPSLPNIIHIAPTYDKEVIACFLNTIDYSLHARHRGETFGLAVAEACAAGKPVITFIDSPERNHIEMLGAKGIYYSSKAELSVILQEPPRPTLGYKELVSQYSPERVMEKFNDIFLK